MRVRGLDEVTTGLASVVTGLDELEPAEVGDIILQAARARTPVDSGFLRSSSRSVGMTVTFSAPYAAPIHWGWAARHIEPNPYALNGLKSSESVWVDAFTQTVQQELDRKV